MFMRVAWLCLIWCATTQVYGYSRTAMENYRRYYYYLQQMQENDMINQRQNTAGGQVDDRQRAGQDEQADPPSRCSSHEYRQLSGSLQNEHQCLQLEAIQKNIATEKDDLDMTYKRIMKGLADMSSKIDRVTEYIQVSEALETLDINDFLQPREVPIAKDCYTLGKKGFKQSGTYPIYTTQGQVTLVSCDLDTDAGGWTVIQRRVSDRIHFNRTWNEYKRGFGNPNGDYWVGNELVHKMTKYRSHMLRIDMWDWSGNHVYASYEDFSLGSERKKYKITYGAYHGNGGDSFKTYHNNTAFSTPDRDNDSWFASCASKDSAGWWYRDCSYAALNGPYHNNGRVPIGPAGVGGGLLWYEWKGDHTYSLKKVEMKIRPMVGY